MCSCCFFIFLRGKGHINWPISNFFGTLGISLDPKLQYRNKCATLWPAFLVCMHGSWTLGKTTWDKTEVLYECLEKQLGNLGKPLGTPLQHDGNSRKKNIKSSPYKKKKTRPLMSARWAFSLAAWNSCFQNCLAWANGRATNCGTQSSQMPSIWSTYFTSELLLQLGRLGPFWNWLHCIQCLAWL